MEGIHHRNRVGQLFSGRGLEPGEAVHGNNFHLVTPFLRPVGQPVLERAFGAALDHVEQPGRAGLVADRGEIDDDVTYLSPRRVWRHTCSSTPITRTSS